MLPWCFVLANQSLRDNFADTRRSGVELLSTGDDDDDHSSDDDDDDDVGAPARQKTKDLVLEMRVCSWNTAIYDRGSFDGPAQLRRVRAVAVAILERDDGPALLGKAGIQSGPATLAHVYDFAAGGAPCAGLMDLIRGPTPLTQQAYFSSEYRHIGL